MRALPSGVVGAKLVGERMMRIEMDEREWQGVLAILSQAPWGQANGLILKIGEQMRMQAQPQHQGRANGDARASEDLPAPDGRQRPS